MDLLGLELYKDTEELLRKYYDKISKTKILDEKIELLNDLYKYIKSVTPDFFIDGKMSYYYKKLKPLIIKCESLFDGNFLIPNNPIYKSVSSPNLSSNNYSSILDYIVYETRKYLLNICQREDLSKLHLANCCTISNCKVLNMLDHFGFEDTTYSIIVTPGFVDMPQLFDGSGYHCITILNLDEKYFLIDCTYSQYFNLGQNSLHRIGLVDFMNCRPGKFMTMNNDRLNVAESLLTRGWIELNERTFKDYFDGFALFYRNGLYYELTGDYSYTTNYTAKDYRNFLEKKDSQLNYEKKHVLGFQRVPNSKYL